MNEKEFIKNIKKLRNVKPDKDWAVFAKNEILGVDKDNQNKVRLTEFVEIIRSLTLKRKLACVTITALFLVMGISNFAQRSLPGDRLYVVRKTTEQLQSIVSGENEMVLGFNTANRRLEDLRLSIEKSSEKNITSSVNELQDSLSQIARSVDINKTENIEVVEEQIERLEQEAVSLGVKVETNEDLRNVKNNIVKRNVENEISFWENVTLTEKQQEILKEAKDLFAQGEYRKAEEKIAVDLQMASQEIEENNEVGIAGEEIENNNE